MKNTKKSYFENLGTKKITDNRSFRRIVVPLLSKNPSKTEKINLIYDDKTISTDEELRETFNQFLSKVVPTLEHTKT